MSKAMPRPRLKPISFVSTGSRGSTSPAAISSLRSICDMRASLLLAGERRLETAEEKPGDQQPDPDHEPEQADKIDRGKLAKTLLPEFSKIRQDADREEGQHEEDHPEDIGLTGSRRQSLGDLRRRAKREPKRNREHQDEAEDEFREPLPDFEGLGAIRS